MVVIRLQRGGVEQAALLSSWSWRIRAARRAASSSSGSGSTTRRRPKAARSLRVNMERVKHWTGKGAQLSRPRSALVKQFAKKAAWSDA